MKPGELVECVNAILLTGGSAYGLDASTGAMDLLRRRGEGLDVGVSRWRAPDSGRRGAV